MDACPEEDFAPQKVDRKAPKGIRSGNTFRSSGRAYVRRYLKEGFVLVQTRGKPTIPEEMSELGISGDMVPYSLNKKGRWNIASVAKAFINAGEMDFRDGTRVEVVERHKALRKRQFCVSLHSNSVSPRCQTPARGRYLHYDAAPVPVTRKVPRCLCPRKTTRQSQLPFSDSGSMLEVSVRGMANEDDDDVCSHGKVEGDFIDVEIPEVVYDVVSPCPASSSLVRSRKHICRTGQCLQDDSLPTHRRRRKDKEREKRELKSRWKTLIQDRSMEDEHEENFGEFRGTSLERSENQEICDSDIPDRHGAKDETADSVDNYAKVLLRKQMKRRQNGTLPGVLHNADVTESNSEVPMQKQVNDRQNQVLPEEKHKTTVMDRSANVSLQDHVAQRLVQTPSPSSSAPCHKALRLLPVPVLLSCQETRPPVVHASLGSLHIEASCRPRKFLVDIGRSVGGRLRSSKTLAQYRGQQLETTAFVVFVESEEASSSGENMRAFQVSLNMALSAESLRIETILDYESCSVQDVIDKTIRFISSLPVESFVKKYVQTETDFTHTSAEHTPAKKRVEAMYANEGLLAEALGQMSDTPQDELSTCKVCHNCYEDVDYSQGGAPGTRLFCGHWYCDACWREHLLKRIQDGASKLVCPAYGCDLSVDAATALTLVPVERVLAHLRQLASRTDAAKRTE